MTITQTAELMHRAMTSRISSLLIHGVQAWIKQNKKYPQSDWTKYTAHCSDGRKFFDTTPDHLVSLLILADVAPYELERVTVTL